MTIEYKVERIVETRNGETTKDEIRIEREKTINWGGIPANITKSSSYFSFPTDELSTLLKKLQALSTSQE